jgi:hypothetical protein
MSFCSASGAINSESQLNTPFPSSVLSGLSSNSGRITAEGDMKGRLTAASLDGIYTAMVGAGHLVSNTQYQSQLNTIATAQTRAAAASALSNLGTTESTTMGKIREEFCYTYFRYKFALETLFDKLVATSKLASIPTADRTIIQSRLDKAKEFNQKLNDIIQITNHIATKRASEMRQQNSDINSLNQNIQSTFNTLQSHSQILNKETSISDLRKRMVEFTEEKNRSAVNLLSLYGFLNLVAIGLLFYIARS